MGRIDIPKSRIRKAMRRIARARADAEEAGDAARLSEWEADYLGSVEERLSTYGSAFRDPTLGRPDEPLSRRQKRKLDEIDAKLKGETKDADAKKPSAKRLTTKKPLPSAKAAPAAKDGKPMRPQGGLKRRTPLGARRTLRGG